MDRIIYDTEFFKIGISILFIVLATFRLVTKKRLLTNTNLPSEKAEKIVNAICIPIVYLGLIYLLFCTLPVISDIPTIKSKAYIETKAIAVSHSLSNPDSYEKRYVDMEIDGKVEHMTLYSFGINEGREYEIIYLPNSKIGQVKTYKEYHIRFR